jgi:hypothetical protein
MVTGDAAAISTTPNIVLRDEHVPGAERYIHTIKECTRCVYNLLPFLKMPNRMITKMVYTSVFWLNMSPTSDGVSTTLSPLTIVAGLGLDYTNHCHLESGTYVQVHEEHDNTMATQTTGTITLQPTGNAQGGNYFLA